MEFVVAFYLLTVHDFQLFSVMIRDTVRSLTITPRLFSVLAILMLP
nr:hypothetical protein [Alkalihalobacterium alkalinitrilicum]